MRITVQPRGALSPAVARPAAAVARKPATVLSGPVNPFRSAQNGSNSAFANVLSKFASTSPALSSPAAALASSSAATLPNASSTPVTTATSTPTAAATTAPAAAAASTPPGIMALVDAMMKGTVKVTYKTDPAALTETTPYGTDFMPSCYYLSDDSANQIAQLMGGTVVQMAPFRTTSVYVEPKANFIQLPGGQTVNAADLAYYARYQDLSGNQLTACLTMTVNQGAAWTNYNQKGGTIPSFPLGFVGPPIPGMTYPDGMIGADGNVINPMLSA